MSVFFSRASSDPRLRMRLQRALFRAMSTTSSMARAAGAEEVTATVSIPTSSSSSILNSTATSAATASSHVPSHSVPSESAPKKSEQSQWKPPLSGLVAIVKPSGRTCMSLLDTLKPLLAQSKFFQVPANEKLQEKNPQYHKKRATKRRRDFGRFTEASGGFMAPKIGQGGTLDPLAEGVLILGIGAGTKKLQQFLDCTKEYKTVALLGSSTLSYDACEPILLRRPFSHVSADMIREEALPAFRGKFKQLPPLFSAIRIDGKRLFDYAREGIDLPRPIEGRDVEVTQLELVDWKDGKDHGYREPDQECSEEERRVAVRARKLAGLEGSHPSAEEPTSGNEDCAKPAQEIPDVAKESATTPPETPPTFTLQMTVSSGTYVRSIVHDVGAKVNSAAHVVRLSRTRQGDWISSEYQVKADDDASKLRKAIDWEVIEKAALALEKDASNKRQKTTNGETEDNSPEENTNHNAEDDDDSSPAEWEQYLMDHMQIIEP